MRRALAIFPLASCVLLAPAAADEVRLKDGTVLVGATKKTGKFLAVKTTGGTVKVAVDDVLRVRTDEELRTELAALSEKTANTGFGRLQLARAARDWGLLPEMWKTLDGCLARGDTSDAQRERVRGFLAELEPEVLPLKWRKQSTTTRVRELVFRIKPRVPDSLAAAVEELLVREPDAREALRERARKASKPAQRIVALRALSRRNEGDDGSFVLRSTILDPSVEVRAGAARAIRERGQTAEAVQYLAPGLMHPHPAMRIRTAEAFGHMREPSAAAILVQAGPLAGKSAASLASVDDGSTNGNIAFLQQQSYIRDFNVEVAQASFIADPQVDVLQFGSVLDTKVHAVFTHRTQIVGAYRGALQQIAGGDPGYDTGKWNDWFDEQRRK